MTQHSKEVEDFLSMINEVKNYIGLTAPNFINQYSIGEESEIRNVIVEVMSGGYAEKVKEAIERDYDLTIAEQHGGTEGDGDTHWFVFKWHDMYFRLPGFYSSYDDNEYYWDNVKQVLPEPKSIIVFKDI